MKHGVTRATGSPPATTFRNLQAARDPLLEDALGVVLAASGPELGDSAGAPALVDSLGLVGVVGVDELEQVALAAEQAALGAHNVGDAVEERDDTEVVDAALECQPQVRVRGLRDVEHLAARQHDLVAAHVVAAKPCLRGAYASRWVAQSC